MKQQKKVIMRLWYRCFLKNSCILLYYVLRVLRSQVVPFQQKTVAIRQAAMAQYFKEKLANTLHLTLSIAFKCKKISRREGTHQQLPFSSKNAAKWGKTSPPALRMIAIIRFSFASNDFLLQPALAEPLLQS